MILAGNDVTAPFVTGNSPLTQTPAQPHHRAGNSNYAKFSLETWPTLLTVRNKLATDIATSHGGVLFFKHASCVSFLFIVIIFIFSQPLGLDSS